MSKVSLTIDGNQVEVDPGVADDIQQHLVLEVAIWVAGDRRAREGDGQGREVNPVRGRGHESHQGREEDHRGDPRLGQLDPVAQGDAGDGEGAHGKCLV